MCKKSGGKRSDPKYVAVKIHGDRGNKDIRFEVVEARSEAALGSNPSEGSKGGDATCLLCGTVADSDHVKAEGYLKRFGHRSSTDVQHVDVDESSIVERIGVVAAKHGITIPAEPFEPNSRFFDVQHFGFTHWRGVRMSRQLLSMTCFAGQIRKAHAESVNTMGDEDIATALATCLSRALGRLADYCTSFCTWQPEFIKNTFNSAGMPMWT